MPAHLAQVHSGPQAPEVHLQVHVLAGLRVQDGVEECLRLHRVHLQSCTRAVSTPVVQQCNRLKWLTQRTSASAPKALGSYTRIMHEHRTDNREQQAANALPLQ